ncbi:Ubiquitin carboxyl-terminal hydrolase 44, partial [Xenoophorus captivus]
CPLGRQACVMDRCKHVGRLRLAPDHSILNPQKWHCVDCNTTESVWACLGCAHVACGRYIEEHALQHFQQQSHPLAMEVNELYVFCYLCDDYVLNDNATGDLKLLRSTLSAIQSQRYEVTTRSGRTLRSASIAPDALIPCGASELQLRDEDRMFTALWHRRRALIGRIFRLWFGLTECGKRREEEERKREQEEEQKREARERRRAFKRQLQEELENAPLRKSRRLRRKSQRVVDTAIAPAVKKNRKETKTLSQTRRPRTQSPATATSKKARQTRKSQPSSKCQRRSSYTQSKPRTPSSTTTRNAQTPVRRRQSTKQDGSPLKRRPTVTPGVTGLRNLGNTCYMNSILQVLSHLHVFRECFLRLDLTQALELLASAVHGQLTVKTTSQFPLSQRKGLHSTSGASTGLSGGASRGRSMELIQPKEPSSKHISLCHELHTLFQVMWSGKWALVSPFAMLHSVWQLIPAFRGYAQQDAQEFLCELLDKVQQELESTGRHTTTAGVPQKRLIKQVLSVVNTIFHGHLLSQVRVTHKHSSLLLSNSEIMVHVSLVKRETFSAELKQVRLTVLWLILRWSGRNHREKIGVHVSFDQLLNMEPYCCRESSPKGVPCSNPSSPSAAGSPRPKHFLYELSAVVMHHGKGFGSGHYTAYCYNTEGGEKKG